MLPLKPPPERSVMKKTVVVVDDHADVRNQLVEVLKSAPDITCLYAVDSAEAALIEIPKNIPDVVLLDINLRRMSGIDCIPLLKEKAPSLEILMLTVYEEEDVVLRALKAGATGYLLKSSQPEELFAAIRDVHAGGAPFSSSIARKVVHYFQSGSSKAVKNSEKLSSRELELLELLAAGFINKEIAEEMNLTLETVRTYVKRIYAKLQVRNRTEAALKHRASTKDFGPI
jgi:DNA-binding NarL/FixJ family response regulator